MASLSATKWITHPPSRCPSGHTLGPGKVLVRAEYVTVGAVGGWLGYPLPVGRSDELTLHTEQPRFGSPPKQHPGCYQLPGCSAYQRATVTHEARFPGEIEYCTKLSVNRLP